MGTLKQMLQAVVAAATARTTSTVTDNDLIQLYDTNNQPTIKITKSVLMDCVRASLGSLLNASGADQGTSGAKFPSINAAGVLGSMTAANLASVLGGSYRNITSGQDLNQLSSGVYVSYDSSLTNSLINLPSGVSGDIIIVTNIYGYSGIQKIYIKSSMVIFLRTKNGETWNNWKQLNPQ